MSFNGGEILIVDDDKAVLYVLRETLTRDGYSIDIAESGENALKIAEEKRFDLALIDLKLKGMNGLELVSLLRQKMPDLAIIVLTAHASLDSAIEALRLGAVDYLFKPCKTEDLRASIKRAQQMSLQKQQKKHLIKKMKQLINQIEDGSDEGFLPQSSGGQTVGEVSKEYSGNVASVSSKNRFLRRGVFSIDFLRHIITYDGNLLDLSPTEYNLLVYLISEAPRVISSTELFREVQGYLVESWQGGDTVRFHIYRLRQKLKSYTGQNNIIVTVRGVGYSINEQVIQ